jgi:hypothetical protein
MIVMIIANTASLKASSRLLHIFSPLPPSARRKLSCPFNAANFAYDNDAVRGEWILRGPA